jgi:hypothetical protein
MIRKLNSILFFLLILLCATASIIADAQIVQPHRYEKEEKGREENYTVISLQEKGIALLREKDKYSGMKRVWELILLDTTLTENAAIEFSVDSRYPLIGYEVTPTTLYTLYRTGDTNKNNFLLITFDLTTANEIERSEIDPELDFKITHFSKVGSSIALGGYVSNDPAILLYDLNHKSIKVVPGFFQKDNELVDLRVNQNETFNVLLIDRSTKAARKLVFRTFDDQGKLLLEDIVAIEDEKSLQSSLTSTLQREDLGVFGTWGDRTGKQALGFFALSVDPFSEQKIKYYHFGELENFLDYLNPKRAERIKENTREDVKAGRKPSFSAYVVPYRIQENKEGYVVLAEIYNPITTSPYANSPYGNPYYMTPYSYYNPFYPGYYRGMRVYRPYSYGNNVRNTNEVKTYASVVIAFDPQGNLLWDESIKLDDVEKLSLDQVADFYTDKKVTSILYRKESDLKLKMVDNGTKEARESSHAIRLNKDSDEVRNEQEQEGGVRHWYSNNFYVWGFQTVRDASKKSGDKTRNVFYINKVVVQ